MSAYCPVKPPTRYRLVVVVVSFLPMNFSFIPTNSFRCSHVQVNNESAIEFYKKFGFEIVETKNHYYKRIEPADAHVLEKNLKNVKNCDPSAANSNEATKQNGLDSQLDGKS